MAALKKYLFVSWHKNKSFLFLTGALLAACSLLKLAFYFRNRSVLENAFGGEKIGASLFRLGAWSLLYDLITIIAINFPFLLLLNLLRPVRRNLIQQCLLILCYLVNSIMLLLNCMDVFYYSFYFQRANADLLYVLDHSLDRLSALSFWLFVGMLLSTGLILFATWQIHRRFIKFFRQGSYATGLLLVLGGIGFILLLNRRSIEKIIIPTYPLVSVNTKELQLVQNSFHTFCYSVYRSKNPISPRAYYSSAYADSLFPIKKIFTAGNKKKNVVLFIMEGVSANFFTDGDRFRVQMPFLDSLLTVSTYFSNAYSYAYESNKGIVSILAGIPTLTDIPLYHSSFTTLPFTPIGSLLRTKGYHSFFCIGDEFDNFGFAKCASWMGLDHYYCKTNIPGYRNIPSHLFGLHDEYVLDFMRKKIHVIDTPFLAVNFNISTHFPYDVPASFRPDLPAHYSQRMKSMRYYDYSLQSFFSAAAREAWFGNTVFIFCSDHWTMPGGTMKDYSNVSGFKIPLFIYDPSDPLGKVDNHPVSQFDIIGTIASEAGIADTVITYGNNLLEEQSLQRNSFVYTRLNNSLYQAMDSSFMLGYNIVTEEPAYLYQYSMDAKLENNLINTPAFAAIKNVLTEKVKLFVQKASMQYFNRPFK